MRAPPLGELYDLLRSDGFQIGVDDHVRVNRLLAREAAWSVDSLRVAIGALVVKDRRDQPAFDGCWSRWLAAANEVTPSMPELPPAAAISEPRSLLRRTIAVASGLVVIAIVAWWITRSPREQQVVAPDAIAVASGVQSPTTTQDGLGPDGGTAVDAGASKLEAGVVAVRDAGVESARDAATVDAAMTADAGVDAGVVAEPSAAASDRAPSSPRYEGWLAVFVILAGAAIAALAAVLLVRLAMRRRGFIPGPWSYRVSYPAPKHATLGRLAIEDAAGDLTWQAEMPGQQLDLDRSIARTVRAGGMPDLVYARPPAAAEYIVLEDRAAGSERWSFVYDELLRGLQREGVRITRYTYVATPDHVQSLDGKSVELATLLEHADGLLVIGDGDAGFDPVTDRPAEWLATLRQVSQRLWINPLPRSRWSRGASAIAHEIAMEHGVARALEGLRPGGAVPRAVRPFAPVISRAPSTKTAIDALRTFLGEMAFLLVEGMAVAGPPSMSAARWLAELLELALDEESWLRLSSLPWIATKAWPPQLRERLVERMIAESPERVDRIGAAADQLLLRAKPPPGSGAYIKWELDLAVRRFERGDVRGAEVAFAKIATTPFQHDAVELRRRLGYRDRRGRARVAAIALGISLVVLGLDPLGDKAPAPASPQVAEVTAFPKLDATNRKYFRIAVDGLEVTKLADGKARFSIGARPIEMLTGAVLEVNPNGWRMSFGDWAVPPKLDVRQDTRPLLVVFALQGSLASTVLPPLEEVFGQLPNNARFGVVELGRSVYVHPFDKLPREARTATDGPQALRAGVDHALRILENAAMTRRVLVVISDGTDDNIGVDLATLGERAAANSIEVEAIGYSPTDRRADLFKLGDLARPSEGGFTWVRSARTESWTVVLTRMFERIKSSVLLVAERDAEDLTGLAISAKLNDQSTIMSREVPIPDAGRIDSATAQDGTRWGRFVLRVTMGLIAALALFELLFGWLYSAPFRRSST